MSKMDELGFKFQIGDIVAMKGSCTETATEGFFGRQDSTRYLVLERLAQECPDGTQLHYQCRHFRVNGEVGLQLIRFLEIELIPSEAFRKMSAEEINERDQQQIAAAEERKAKREAAKAAKAT